MKKVLSVVLTLAMLLTPMAAIAEESTDSTASSDPIVVVDFAYGEAETVGGNVVSGQTEFYTPETDGKMMLIATAGETESKIMILNPDLESSDWYVYGEIIHNEELDMDINQISYTLDMKAGEEISFDIYGGASDNSGEFCYTMVFFPGLLPEDDDPVVAVSYAYGKTETVRGNVISGQTEFYTPEVDGKLTLIAMAVDNASKIMIDNPDLESSDWYVYGTIREDEVTGEKMNCISYTCDVKAGEGISFSIYGGASDNSGAFGYLMLFSQNPSAGGTEVTEGTLDNPIELATGETISVNTSNKVYYRYFAFNTGTLKFDVLESDVEWNYSIWKSGDTENVTTGGTTLEYDVEQLTSYIICAEGFFDFTTEFALPKPKYTVAEGALVIGANQVKLNADAESVVYEFTPAQDGVYKFTTTEGVVGYWGTSNYIFDGTENKSATLELVLSEGQGVMIGISAEKEGVLTIERTGDKPLTESDFPVVEHKNESTPVAAWSEELKWVNVTDDIKDSAVLGADGFYHLNKADGPIIFVDLSSVRFNLDLADANEHGAFKYSIKTGEQTWERGNYKELFAAYYEAGPVVALSKELQEMFQKVGETKGWYDKESWNYLFGETEVNAEEAWMFACRYANVSEEDANPEITFENVTGDANTYDRGNGKDMVIRIDKDLDEFKGLYLDGKLVPEEYYELKEGSTIIILKASYLNSFENGEHTFAAVYEDGSAPNFSVSLSGEIEGTGDVSAVMVYLVILLGAAALTVGFVSKKRIA